MVGTIGHKTAVANNDQIVEGISGGVAFANGDLLNALYAVGSMIVKAVEDKEMCVELDGMKVSRQLRPYDQQLSKHDGGSLVKGGVGG